MGKVLIIGAGGVATVAAVKVAKNSDVFSEIMIASRTKSKCDAIVQRIGDPRIRTAQVDADNVDELVALFKDFKPELVMNLALPYQDLTIMEACLQCGVNYLDTANYEPKDVAHFEYSWQWAYRERFEQAGLTAILGCGFDPGVTSISPPMPPSTTSTKYNTSISSIATPATTTRPLPPISIPKSTSARLPKRVSTGKTASGWRPSRSKSTSRLLTPTSARAKAICSTTKR